MYLLDTDVICELRKTKAGQADPHVIAWADHVPTALVHDLTVVTRNVADFAPTEARIMNPWTL